jgi:hypothetical protein
VAVREGGEGWWQSSFQGRLALPLHTDEGKQHNVVRLEYEKVEMIIDVKTRSRGSGSREVEEMEVV